MDRGVDVPVMLHHPWTYHALAADTLDVRLNHITVESEEKGRVVKKTYDVDISDPFWAENAGRIFPTVAEEVDAATKKYKADSEELTRRTGMDPNAVQDPSTRGDAATKELTMAMSQLPEMQERKRRLDIHTHVATTLLGQIKQRDLHGFHKLEQGIIMRQPIEEGDLEANLLGEGKGKLEDRVRLFFIYYLCTEEIPAEKLAAYEEALTKAGADIAGLKYLKGMKALNAMSASAATGQRSGTAVADGGAFGSFAGKWLDKVSSAATQAVKNLIPVGDQLAATRLVESIMEQKSSPEVDAFAYLDPKARSGGPRVSAAFKESIVFVVGGGSYTEYQNMQDCIATDDTGRRIVYGATELASAEAFLGQLAELGAASASGP